MADLLREWLHDEVQIDDPLDNFEEDCANGYVFAQVLHRFNQQKDLSLFQLTEHADAKVTNMCLLEPTLRALNIKFTSRQAYAIMQGQKGEAAKLLYQVRVALERLDKTTAPVSLREEGPVKRLNNMPIRMSRPHFDEVSHQHFASAIRSMVQNQNEVLEGRALKRFQDEATRQAETARVLDQADRAALIARTDETRRQRMHQAQREQEFLSEWQDRGLAIWAYNQELARQRRATKKRVTQKLAGDRSSKQLRELEHQQGEVRDEIAAFERRRRNAVEVPETSGGNGDATMTTSSMMVKTGLDNAVPSPARPGETAEELAERLERAVPEEHELRLEGEAQLRRIAQNKKQHQQNAVQREKRRRKFLACQMREHEDVNGRRNTQRLADSLLRPSHIEEALNAEQLDISGYQAVFEENRAFRREQYTRREAADAEQAKVVDAALFQHIVVDNQERVEHQLQHLDQAVVARDVANHQANIEFCADLLGRVVDLALSVAHYRVYADDYGSLGDPLAPWAWTQMVRQFASLGIEVHAPPEMQTEGVEAGLEQVEAVDALLNQEEWRDYVAPRPEDAPALEAEEIALPEGGVMVVRPDAAGEVRVEPQHALGEVVLATRLSARPLPSPAPRPSAPAFKLRLAVLGKPCSGKSSVVRALADKFRLAVIDIEEVMDRALAAAEGAPEEPSLVLESVYSVASVPPTAEPSAEPSAVATAEPSEASVVAEKDSDATSASEQSSASSVASSNNNGSSMQSGAAGEGEGEGGGEGEQLDPATIEALDFDNELWRLAGPEGPGAIEAYDPEAGLAAERILCRLGHEAMRALASGEEVDDEVYARLVVLTIKMLDRAACNGWVLDGFPANQRQAELFERFMGGYDATAVVPCDRDYESDLAPGVPKRPQDPLERDPQSAVDLILSLDSDDAELARRCLGPLFRRFNVDRFHAELAPPPEEFEHKRLLEHLDEPHKSTHTFSTRVAGHVHRTGELLSWQSRFGNVQTLNAAALPEPELCQTVEEVVLQLERQQLAEAEQRTAEAEAAAAREAEAEAAREAEAEQLQQALADAAAALAAANAKQEAEDAPPEAAEEAAEAAAAVAAAQQALSAFLEPPVAAGPAPLSQRLATPLALHWNVSESLFRNSLLQHFSTVRGLRMQAVTHYHEVREQYLAFLRRPDVKQDSVQRFQEAFNSIDQDLRFDDATKAELHLRTAEVVADLLQQTRTREKEAVAEFASVRSDGWLEDHVVEIQRCFVRAMQAEADRHVAASQLLQEYYGLVGAPELRTLQPIAGQGVEGSVSVADDDDGAGPDVDHAAPPLKDIHSLLLTGEEKEEAEQDEELARLRARQARAAAKAEAALVANGGVAPAVVPGQEEEEEPEDPYPLLVTALANAMALTAPPPKKDREADEPPPAAAAKGGGGGGKRARSTTPAAGEDDDDEADKAAAPAPEDHLAPADAAARAVLAARLERLNSEGRALCEAVVALAERVYGKLEGQFRHRLDCEFSCVKSLEQLARAAIEMGEPLPSELRFEGAEIVHDHGTRTFAAPQPAPAPVEEAVDVTTPSSEQIAVLVESLQTASEVSGGADPETGELYVSRDAFLAVMQRLVADDVALPERWTRVSDEELERAFAELGDEEQEVVRVDTVVSRMLSDSGGLLGAIIAPSPSASPSLAL